MGTPHPYHEKNPPYAIALYLSTLGEFLGRVFLQPRKQTASRQWTRVKRFWKGISTVTVIIVFLFCVLWNAQHHVHETHLVVLQVISEVAQLDQWWGMFSPNPPLEYGWFVMKGQLQNGKIVDLMPGSSHPMEEPSNEKPALISAQYPTQRWRKYLMNMSD